MRFSMIAPMPFHRFKRLVRQYGCSVEKTRKEWRVIDGDGKPICNFAVTHGKQEVKPVYISLFLNAIGELGI